MISCTEFIPAYSELFKFIDQKSGRQAVYDFWNWLFQPEKSPLNDLLAEYGMMGIWKNWYVVYTEEACDNTMIHNEREGWHASCMHSCPSKGRFDKLGYMEPFDEYCKHCECYDITFKKYGIESLDDYRGDDRASCRGIKFDPKVFKGDAKAMVESMYRCEMNGGCKIGIDDTQCPLYRPDNLVLRTSADDYKYLHPGFHRSMALGASFVMNHYGADGLREYLKQFTLAFHVPLLDAIKEKGLAAVAEYMRWLYTTEEAPDALEMAQTDKNLLVTIHYCPAVKFLKNENFPLDESFACCTSMVYEALAEASGLGFEMLRYDHDTGAAQFRFFCK